MTRTNKSIGRRVYEFKRFTACPVERFAGVSQLECAIDTTEQRLSELFLQSVDGVAYSRLRHKLIASRTRETQVSRGRTEGTQQIERQSRRRTFHEAYSCLC